MRLVIAPDIDRRCRNARYSTEWQKHLRNLSGKNPRNIDWCLQCVLKRDSIATPDHRLTRAKWIEAESDSRGKVVMVRRRFVLKIKWRQRCRNYRASLPIRVVTYTHVEGEILSGTPGILKISAQLRVVETR